MAGTATTDSRFLQEPLTNVVFNFDQALFSLTFSSLGGQPRIDNEGGLQIELDAEPFAAKRIGGNGGGPAPNEGI